MKRKYNEKGNKELYNKEQISEEIPFAVDEELIQEIQYDEVPENEVPFAVDGEMMEEESELDVPFPMNTSKEKENDMSSNVRKKSKKKTKRKKKVLITVLIILLILAVCAGAGYFYIKNYFDSMGIANENDIYNYMTKVDSSKVEDIEKLDKVNILLLGVDKDGTRSDSIMLVNYNIKTNKINLLSIPRDTRIYVEDKNTYRKITEVHAMHDKNGKMYGASAVAQAVIALTGMDINYYMEFSFDALDKIMDELGPVKFDVPDLEGKGRGMNYDDGYQDLHIHLKPGMQELSGNQIQQFLRYRKSNYKDAQNVFGSDLERVERQQALLGAIIDQKLNAGLITKAPKILETVRTNIKTTFTGDELLAYVQFLMKDERYASISSENMESFVLPGGSQMISGKSYFICNEAKTAEMLRINFAVDVQKDDISNVINITEKKTSGKIKTSTKKAETSKSTSSSQNTQKKESNTKSSDNEITRKKTNESDEKKTTQKTTESDSKKSSEKTNESNTSENKKNDSSSKKNETSESQTGKKPTVQTSETDDSDNKKTDDEESKSNQTESNSNTEADKKEETNSDNSSSVSTSKPEASKNDSESGSGQSTATSKKDSESGGEITVPSTPAPQASSVQSSAPQTSSGSSAGSAPSAND